MKPTKARIEAMREAVKGSWRPYGGPQWRLESYLRGEGMIYNPVIGGTSRMATEAGKKWLAANDSNSPDLVVDGEIVTKKHIPRIHQRYSDKPDRPDLRSLAKCNNLNGAVFPPSQLTSNPDEVTCGRCKRIG